ncbi:Hypothetical predicted protein [Podarcis lilfordi]|uniref:Uncharacterized protein n=1 Tax=Podarcis lilfordi TaxID=74358 RepID=A0AA35L4K3_9SAUR|nr:Hypothetical predicted protein [Podarcis lilfordi]
MVWEPQSRLRPSSNPAVPRHKPTSAGERLARTKGERLPAQCGSLSPTHILFWPNPWRDVANIRATPPGMRLQRRLPE